MKNLIYTYRKTIIIYLLLGVGISYLSILQIHFLQTLLDGLGSHVLEPQMIFLYGLLLFTLYILGYLDNIPHVKLNHGIYLSLKEEAVKKMSTIAYHEYQHLGMGRLMQQVENGSAAGRDILFNFYFPLLREQVPGIVFSLIFIAGIDTTILVIIVTGYLLVFLVTNILLKRLYRIKNSVLVNEEQLNKSFVRGIMELVVLRTNRQYARELQKIKSASNEVVSAKVRILMVHEAFFTIFELLVSFLKILILLYGLYTGKITVGATVALLSYLDKAYTPIAIFNVKYVSFRLNQVAWNRYKSILDLEDDTRIESGIRPCITKGRINFCGVRFSYDHKVILDDFTVLIPGGSSICLTGESGTGKSSVVKLIMGLNKPQQGEIFIDGLCLSQMCLGDYYDYISYTPQESPVFDGTLKENIVFDKDIEDKEIMAALSRVYLVDKANAIGLCGEIGEKGTLLSGGERQRLALARLYFSKAKIMILDEATSAMNAEMEEAIVKNLLSDFKGSTIILISHGETVKNFTDKVLSL